MYSYILVSFVESNTIMISTWKFGLARFTLVLLFSITWIRVHKYGCFTVHFKNDGEPVGMSIRVA